MKIFGVIHLKGLPGSTSNSLSLDEIIKQLIEFGVDINMRESNGETPLMKAALQDHLSSVNIMLTAGNDINAQENYGNTALIIASKKGYNDIVA